MLSAIRKRKCGMEEEKYKNMGSRISPNIFKRGEGKE